MLRYPGSLQVNLHRSSWRRKRDAPSCYEPVQDGTAPGWRCAHSRRLREPWQFRVAGRQRRCPGCPDGCRGRGLHQRQVQRRRSAEVGPQDSDRRVRAVGEGGESVPDRRDPVDQGRGRQAWHQAPDDERRIGSEQGDLRHQGDDRSGRSGADHLATQFGGPRPGARLRQVQERADHDDRPIPHDEDSVHRLHRLGRLGFRGPGPTSLRRPERGNG